MTIRINIENTWHVLTPDFEEIKIIKKRDEKQLLQVRLLAETNFTFYANDYDLLFDYVNQNNKFISELIEQKDGETVTYRGLITLDNEIDFNKKIITGSFILTDDYFWFLETTSEIGFDYKQPFGFGNLIKPVVADNDLNNKAMLYKSGSQIIRMIRDMYQSICFSVQGELDINLSNYIYYINATPITPLLLEDYCIVGTAECIDFTNSYPEVDYSREGDFSCFISFNDISDILLNFFGVFWYLDKKNDYPFTKSLMTFVEYSESLFTNGTDLRDLRGFYNPETDKYQYIENKISKITYINGDEGRFRGTSEFITNSLYFKNLKLNEKEIVMPFMSDWNGMGNPYTNYFLVKLANTATSPYWYSNFTKQFNNNSFKQFSGDWDSVSFKSNEIGQNMETNRIYFPMSLTGTCSCTLTISSIAANDFSLRYKDGTLIGNIVTGINTFSGIKGNRILMIQCETNVARSVTITDFDILIPKCYRVEENSGKNNYKSSITYFLNNYIKLTPEERGYFFGGNRDFLKQNDTTQNLIVNFPGTLANIDFSKKVFNGSKWCRLDKVVRIYSKTGFVKDEIVITFK